MSERRDMPADDGWKDIHLDDIIKGVSTFVNMFSDAVESAVGQSRGYKVRPLANAAQSAPARLGAGAIVAGVRDPVVDLFDEGDEIVLIVEWPYVEEAPIEIDLQDDVLSLSIRGERPYSTEVLLPAPADAASLRQECRNDITEIRLRRAL